MYFYLSCCMYFRWKILLNKYHSVSMNIHIYREFLFCVFSYRQIWYFSKPITSFRTILSRFFNYKKRSRYLLFLKKNIYISKVVHFWLWFRNENMLSLILSRKQDIYDSKNARSNADFFRSIHRTSWLFDKNPWFVTESVTESPLG